jgi:hypothetical protein
MSEYSEEEPYKGLTIRLTPDYHAESPESMCENEHYFLGYTETRGMSIGKGGWDTGYARSYIPWGEGPWDPDQCDYEVEKEELREEYEGERSEGYRVYPVRLIDHGSYGSELRHADHDEANGYIFVEIPKTPVEELAAAAKGFSADEIAESILHEWNTYLSGDVWIYDVEDDEGESLDSCGGCYGREHALEMAKEAADYYAEESRLVDFVVLSENGTWTKTAVNLPYTVGEGNGARWIMENPELHGLCLDGVAGVIRDKDLERQVEGKWAAK